MSPGTAEVGEAVTLYGANFGPNPAWESQTTVITYEYDDLYRLTEAVYSGDIEAHYQYVYDAVGNMTAYTEMMGSQTKLATRTFDAANQLQVEYSNAPVSERAFVYDGNGNLVRTFSPGMVTNSQTYTYNQRNLLIHIGYSTPTCIPGYAAFTYDGNGDRVRQESRATSCASAPLETITYANDPLGMTQVLLADDGTTQTAQLYGLDLVGQDDGAGMHLLLADGLGSVRQEMAGGAVQTTTTYDPYGKLLAQTGTSGTVYGYTGEQEDAATGLVYLRARYYNPTLNRFLSADTIVPDPTNPQQYNRYSYTLNNPLRYNDPSGHCTENYDSETQWDLLQECINEVLDLNSFYLEWDPNTNYAQWIQWLMVHADTEFVRTSYPGGLSPEAWNEILHPPAESPKQTTSNITINASYGALSGSFGIGINGKASIIVDMYGNVYLTGGGEVGFKGISGSLTSGWVMEGVSIYDMQVVTVDEEQLESLLTGMSVSAGGGAGPGGVIVGPFGKQNEGYLLSEVGVFSPGAGAGGSYSIMLYDAKSGYNATLLNSTFDYWYWYHYQREN